MDWMHLMSPCSGHAGRIARVFVLRPVLRNTGILWTLAGIRVRGALAASTVPKESMLPFYCLGIRRVDPRRRVATFSCPEGSAGELGRVTSCARPVHSRLQQRRRRRSPVGYLIGSDRGFLSRTDCQSPAVARKSAV